MMHVWRGVLCGAAGLTLLSGAMAQKHSAFGNQSKPMKATVTMLAISSSSRQSFAGNQDTYLADVSVKDGDHQFARVIDQYPGFGLPIRDSVLHGHTLLKMKVTREPECDVPGSQVFLRPGDSALFDASVRDSLTTHYADPIPCFRTLHQTISIAKK